MLQEHDGVNERLACQRGPSAREVGLGDAVGVAGRPLDQFDSITVGVGDPAGPRSVRVVSVGRRIGRNTLNGKIDGSGIQ